MCRSSAGEARRTSRAVGGMSIVSWEVVVKLALEDEAGFWVAVEGGGILED